MAHATIVVHGDLADFVRVRPTAGARRVAAVHDASAPPTVVQRTFQGHQAVKDVLEAAGIPHPEIAAITVNGAPSGFERRLDDGDLVEAWPADAAARAGLVPVLQPAPEDAAEPGFVLDGHLGRLAAYLRMLGFDTWYRTDAADDVLAAVAVEERRILLTRDRGVLRRSIVRRGAFLRSDVPAEQLVEVVRRFGLAGRWQPFGRCLRCNTRLETVAREDVLDRLQPLTRIHYDDFRRCPACDAVYWKGSHHARMTRLLERVRSEVGGDTRD